MKILHSTNPSITHISWNHTDQIHHPRFNRTSINHPNRPHPIRLRAEAEGFNTTPDKALRRRGGENNNKSNGGGDGDGDEEIPDVVQGRIISRILTYVGIPLATGIVLLKVFGAAKERGLWDVPYWLPILTTFITFGASTVGVAYGAISASWDADRKGSLLGFEEAERNWVEIWREEEDE